MMRLLALVTLLMAAPAASRPAEAVVRDFLAAYAAQDLAAVTALSDRRAPPNRLGAGEVPVVDRRSDSRK